MATKKKAAAKKRAAPKIGTIYFLIGNHCSSGDICHPYKTGGPDRDPWGENADVYGPFDNIEHGMAWMGNERSFSNGDVVMVIDTAKGTIARHVVKSAQPTLAPSPR